MSCLHVPLMGKVDTRIIHHAAPDVAGDVCFHRPGSLVVFHRYLDTIKKTGNMNG